MAYRGHSGRGVPFPIALLVCSPLPLVGVLVVGAVSLSVLLATIVAVITVVIAIGVAGLTVGVLAVGSWQVARLVVPALGGRRRPRERLRAGNSKQEVLLSSPVDVLRRRYAAGEIGQHEFRTGLVELLKERYVRGDLTLAEFESRVRHLYSDPALRSPV